MKQEIFNELTADFSCALGKTESQSERAAKKMTSSNLTYGEVDFETVFKVFKWI